MFSSFTKNHLAAAAGFVCLMLHVLVASFVFGAGRESQYRQVTTHPSDDFDPALSPDGRWLAFTSERGGNLDIWVRRVDGGRAYQVTSHQADDYLPVWNTQGNKLAFVSKREDAQGDVWMVRISTYADFASVSGKPKRITTYQGLDSYPSFSPNGKELVFSSDRSGSEEIWVASLKTDHRRQISHGGGTQPEWSPNGEWIAFTYFSGAESSQSDIYLIPAATALAESPRGASRFKDGRIQITSNVAMEGFPTWSPDGEELAVNRFAHDTNLDGRITPDDNPQILRLSTRSAATFTITESAFFDITPHWGADDVIYYPSNRSGNLDIWSAPPQGIIHRAQDPAAQFRDAVVRYPLKVDLLADDAFHFRDTEFLLQRLLALQRVFDLFPEETSWHHRAAMELGYTYWALGYAELSRATFKRATTAYDDREIEGLSRIALCLIDYSRQSSGFDETIRGLREVAEEYSDLDAVAASALLAVADLYMDAENYSTALAEYAKISERYDGLANETAESLLKTGDCFLYLDRTDEAVQTYISLLNMPSPAQWHEVAMNRLWSVMEETQNIWETLPRYRDLIGRYGEEFPELAARAQLRIGVLLSEAGDLESAKIELQNVEAEYPQQRQVVLSSKLVMSDISRRQDNWSAAIASLEHILEETRSAEDEQLAARAEEKLIETLMSSADVLLQLNDFRLASIRYQKVKQLNADAIEAHRGYLQCQYNLRRIDNAIREYELLVAANPKDEILIYSLGLCYSFKATERAELYGEAENIDIAYLAKSNEVIERALEQNYRMVYAYRTLAYNYEMMENVDTIQRAKKRSVIAKVSATIIAPVRSVLRTITFWKEQEPLRNYEKAIEALTTAIGLNDESENPQLEGQLCRNIAHNYYNLGEFGYEKAYEYYIRALSFDASFANRREEAILIERMGHCALISENFIEGPQHLERAISLYRDLDRPERVLLNIKRLALLHQIAGNHVRAIEEFERAVALERQNGNLFEVERLLRNIALNYYLLNEPEEALGFARQSEEILASGNIKEIKPKAARIKIGFLGLYVPVPFINLRQMGAIGSSAAFGFTTEEERALIYTILGRSLAIEKDFSGAIDYFEKKLIIYQKRKDQRAVAAFLNNIGYLLALKGDLPAAWDKFNQSLELCEEKSIVNGIAVNCVNLGQLAVLMEQNADTTTPYGDIAVTRINNSLHYLAGDSRQIVKRKAQLLNILGIITLAQTRPGTAAGDLESSIKRSIADMENTLYARIYFEEASRLSAQYRLYEEEALSRLNLAFTSSRLQDVRGTYQQLSEVRLMCTQRGFEELLWRTDAFLGDLVSQLQSETRELLGAKSAEFYYTEAIELVQSLSEAHADLMTPPYRRVLHQQLYRNAIEYYASRGDSLRAFQLSEEMRAQQFLDIIAGESFQLSSPLKTNKINWVRTYRKELYELEAEMRRQKFSSTPDTEYIYRLEQRQDSVRHFYDLAIADISEEGNHFESLVRVRDVPVESVQSALPPGAVIVDILVYPEKTLIWTISSSHIAMSTVKAGLDSLRRLMTEGRIETLVDGKHRTLGDARQLIFIADDPLRDAAALSLLSTYLRDRGCALTVCASVSSYYYGYSQRTIDGSLVFALGGTSEPFERLGYGINKYDALSPNGSVRQALGQSLLGANVVHWRGFLDWNALYPLQSQLRLRTESGHQVSLHIGELLELKMTASLMLLDVAVRGDPATHGEIANVFERIIQLSGVGTLLFNIASAGEREKIDFYGLFYERLFDVSAAHALLETQRRRAEDGSAALPFHLHGYGGMNPDEANLFAQDELLTTVNAGNLAVRDSDYADALRYYEEALTMAETKGEHTQIYNLAWVIVRTATAGGYYQKAIRYQLRLLEYDRAADNTASIMKRLNDLAFLYVQNGEYALAEQQKKRLIELAETHSPETLPGLFRDLAVIYEVSGHLESALEYYRRSNEIFQELNDTDNVAYNFSEMGRIALRKMDDYAKSLEFLENALVMLADLEISETHIHVLHNLGLTYELLAHYRTALEYQQRALTLADSLTSPDAIALSHYYLANLSWKTGDFQTALQYARRALSLFENRNDAEGISWCYATLGLINLSLGNAEEALRFEETALSLAEENENFLDLATIRKNMGLIYSAEGNLDMALEQFLRAAALDSSINSKRGLAYDHRGLGSLHLQMGALEKAQVNLQKAKQLSEELSDGRNQAMSLYYLGVLEREKKNYERALSYLEQAEMIAASLFIPDVSWRALREIARLRAENGDKELAQQQYIRAIEIIEEMRAKIKVEEYQAGFIDDKSVVYGDLIALLLSMNRDEEALHIAERARSRSFMDILANRDITFRSAEASASLGELRSIEQELLRTQTDIALLRAKPEEKFSAADREALTRAENELVRLRGRYRAQLVSLKESDPELAEMVSVDPLPVEQLQQKLDSKTAVIEYYVDEDRLYIWRIDSAQVESWQVSIAKSELITAVESFRDLIDRELSPAQLGKDLYNKLINPFSFRMDVATLVLVPHDILHYLPFACLQDRGGRYLIEKCALVSVPSSSVLGFCLEKGEVYLDRSKKQLKVLALGNPTLLGDAAPLPMAHKEVESITRSFAFVGSYLENSASETLTLEAGPGHDIFHFACHGEYDAHNPLFSALLLAPDSAHDGRLEAHEIFGRDFSSYLVAMSACETGLGKITGGDEVIGLSRSFIFAGATSLLASLWKVDDLATAVLVKRFFRYIAGGDSRALALQKAQLLVKDQLDAHPKYWAAFHLTGDFR